MLFPNAVAPGMRFAERYKRPLRTQMMLHSHLKRAAKKIPTEQLGVLTCHVTDQISLSPSQPRPLCPVGRRQRKDRVRRLSGCLTRLFIATFISMSTFLFSVEFSNAGNLARTLAASGLCNVNVERGGKKNHTHTARLSCGGNIPTITKHLHKC